MKNIFCRSAAVLFLCAPIPALCQSVPGVTPREEILATVNEIVATVELYPGEANQSVRRAKLREVINPKFDFREMSQRSLGSNWQVGAPAQQKEFVDLFSDLLAKTYLNKIEMCREDTVKIEKEDVDGAKAMVKTTVLYKGDTFPLDYKLMVKEGRWRVYDVVIENIGLVANYRNEFAGIIRKDGFDGLLQQLREKNAR